MKQYSATCPICNRRFEHEKELVVNQMLGYHKRKDHGIMGATRDPEAKRTAARERHWKIKGYSESKIAEMRANYAAKREQSPVHTSDEPVRKTKVASNAVPMPLTECPKCGIRFWYTESKRKDSE